MGEGEGRENNYNEFIPKRIAEYRERDYWEKRYEKDKANHYEWLLSYASLKPLFTPLIKSSDRILILGCGNSKLSEDLYADGYCNLMNIDYSQQVIKTMRDKTQESCPSLEWQVMDMRSLQISSGSFDIIIDKASLDAIWTDGSNVWDPSIQVKSDVKQIVDEIIRVLRPGGSFICVSFGQPHFRLPLLQRPEQWSISVKPIDDTFYFLYTAIKF